MNEWLLWSQAMLLVSIRLTVGLAMTPVFGGFGIPVLARLAIVVSLSLLSVGSAVSLPAPMGPSDMALAAGREFIIGLAMATGVQAAFAAMSAAGRLMDVQMGFSVGAILDPVSKGHSAVMAGSLNMLAVVVFFVSDAHAVLLSTVCRSFQHVPVWSSLLDRGFEHLLTSGAFMFSMGLAMASPVVAALLLTDLVIAVVSRNLPQMNLLFLSIPLKILLGLAVLLVSLKVLGGVMLKMLAFPSEGFLLFQG